MDANYRGILEQTLLSQWEAINPLDAEDKMKLWNSFVEACVKDEFVAKFRREYASRHRIGSRFFKSHRVWKLSTSFHDVIGVPTHQPFKVNILYGSPVWGPAFTLVGLPCALDSIFILERDSIACFVEKKHVRFFFFSGHLGVCFEFTSR